MADQQQIQQCIQQCVQAANGLRTAAHHKKMLDEGAHHLRLCLEECQWSLQQLQTTSTAPAMA